MPDQEIYNTKVTVVMNITASGEEDAIARLSAALTKAGFGILEAVDGYAGAFLAEEGTESSPLPVSRPQHQPRPVVPYPAIWE